MKLEKVKDVSDKYKGSATLFQLSETLVKQKYYDSQITFDYIVVSEVMAPMSGPETFIFPAQSDGEALDFGELPGSKKGRHDHTELAKEFSELALGDTRDKIEVKSDE